MTKANSCQTINLLINPQKQRLHLIHHMWSGLGHNCRKRRRRSGITQDFRREDGERERRVGVKTWSVIGLLRHIISLCHISQPNNEWIDFFYRTVHSVVVGSHEQHPGDKTPEQILWRV
jgi:hypothetical protein